PSRPAAKSVIDGVEVVGMLAYHPPALRRDQLHVDATGQPGSDLVLHVQEVGALLVKAFGPQMCVALGVNELRVKSKPFASVLHAAFEHVSHAEVATDLASVDSFALIGKGGAAGDRKDAGTAREIRRQGFSDAVDKRIVLRAATEVEEGQD